MSAKKAKKTGLQGTQNPAASIQATWKKKQPSAGHPLSKSVVRDQQARIVPIEQLKQNPDQPRRTFDEASIEQLAADIEANGLLNPIAVTEEENQAYRIVAGERRYRALLHLEVAEVPVRVIEPESARVVQLAENLQREDLPIIEEAQALQELKDELGLSIRDLAARTNLSKSYIERRLRVLKWPEELQRALKSHPGLLTRLDQIASIKDEDERRRRLAPLLGDPEPSTEPKKKAPKPRGRPPKPFVYQPKDDGAFDLRVKYRPGRTDRQEIIRNLRAVLDELEAAEQTE